MRNDFNRDFKSASCYSVRCVQSIPKTTDSIFHSTKDSITTDFVFTKNGENYYEIWNQNKDSLVNTGFGFSTYSSKEDSKERISRVITNNQNEVYYYENGAIHFYLLILNDTICYDYTFYENGNLSDQSCDYFEGVRKLPLNYKKYYKNGKLKTEKNWGIYTIKKTDKFEIKAPFYEGDGLIGNKYCLQNGTQYEYNESGKLIEMKIYKDGKLIETKTY